MARKYTNGDCDFFHDCLNGDDVGGENGCYGCVHNLEEED